MPEPGKSDRWNSVLETLGIAASETKPAAAESPSAEASSQAPQAPTKSQPMSMLRPAKPKAAPKPPPAKPAAKSPSYWSRIAGALGLETSSEPEPEPQAKTAEPQAKTPVEAMPERESPREAEPEREFDMPPRAFQPSRSEERQRSEERPRREQRPRHEDRPRRHERPRYEERPQREEPRREERPPREEQRREERPPVAEPGPRSKLDEMFGPKEPDVDVFGLGIEAESRSVRDDEESGPVLEYDQQASSGSDLPLEETSRREPEYRSEEEGERGQRRGRRRRRGRGRRGGGESREGGESRDTTRAHESDIEPAGEDADFDYGREEEFDLDAELRTDRTSDQERAVGQSRQREGSDRYPPGGHAPRERGRRDERGRRRGGEAEREAPPRRRDYGPERPPSRQPYPAERAASQQPSTDADQELDDELSGELDVGDESQGGVPTHKKIPTWDEAVGILIDANMATRANSPDRDRGRGRGRGRR
jgi:hypothetical protein